MNAIEEFLFSNFGGSDLPAIIFKLLLAVIFGGAIGLQRGAHRQAAGFRTHMLVCIGACIVMMTDLFLIEYYSPNADPARLGAQVITGVGFLGAGTIIFAGRQVVGLTTAAGLWASACLGLAIGAGYFSASIVTAILILVVLAFLPKLENAVYSHSRSHYLHIEIRDPLLFNETLDHIRSIAVETDKISISKDASIISGGLSFRLMAKRPKGLSADEMFRHINSFESVYLVEEL